MWWVRFASFWIYPVIGVFFLLLAVRTDPQRRLLELGWLVPTGLFLWSLIEYFWHRLFHREWGHYTLDRLMEKIHLYHHADPRNPDRILVRPLYSLPISGLFVLILYLAAGSFFSTAGIMLGIWTGFLYYEWVHYRIHLSAADGPLINCQRRGHFYHHFVDGKYCFGVTSPFWDLLFGTFRRI